MNPAPNVASDRSNFVYGRIPGFSAFFCIAGVSVMEVDFDQSQGMVWKAKDQTNLFCNKIIVYTVGLGVVPKTVKNHFSPKHGS